MKHRYLISKDTQRQVHEPEYQFDCRTIQTPDGWIIPVCASDLSIDTASTEDYTSVGLYSNEPYTMTGEVIITREQQNELLRELLDFRLCSYV